MNRWAKRIESGKLYDPKSDSILNGSSICSSKYHSPVAARRCKRSLPLKAFFDSRYSVTTFSLRCSFAFASFLIIFVKLEYRWRWKKTTKHAAAFARSSFSFRSWLRMPARPPWRTPPLRSWGQSISNLTFLPTNDLVHRRIYDPLLFLPFLGAFRFFGFISPLSFFEQTHGFAQFVFPTQISYVCCLYVTSFLFRMISSCLLSGTVGS